MTDEETFSFAEVAIQQKLLTREQFQKCRQEQEAVLGRGDKPKPIEDVVVDLGFMKANEVRAVYKAIERFRKDHARATEVRISGYDILEKIGEGGLGIVFKARQVSMGRLVALKVLHPQWVEDEEFRKRFLLEARIVGKLSHNNLIQVFDVGKERGRYFFSMEFVDGETVEDILAREGALPPTRAIDYATQILRAIQYISRLDLVHRDIKPGNILIDAGGNAKLGDFGFVKSRSELEKELGMEGMVLGTPDYIAPEQALGDDVDFRSDIYSLGASLYHMVTGSPPFDGSSSTVMEKHIRARIPDPREINPGVPDPLCHIVEKMMAKKPEDRYKDFRDLFEDLDLVKAGLHPATERLAAGKSTIFRAFRIEKDRIEEIKSEKRKLERRVKQLQFRMFILLVALAFSLMATLVMGLLFFHEL
ncbi:MAG: serine/threonine protein kinase [Planctomycetota bacterium]|jgi:serine/threonine-protein kinase